MTSVRLHANDEIGDLVKELDAADFLKDEPK